MCKGIGFVKLIRSRWDAWVYGTGAYVRKPYSFMADYFSVGVIAYEMVQGRRSYFGELGKTYETR